MKSKCMKPRILLKTISPKGWFYIICMIVTGGIVVSCTKALGEVPPTPQCATCDPVQFDHPYMQTLMMFLGEMLCIIFYVVSRLFAPKRSKYVSLDALQLQTKTPMSFKHTFLFVGPVLCDLLGSTLSNMSVRHCAASVHSMLRNGVILFIALLSFIFPEFRRDFDLPNVLGLFFIFLGLIMVGLVSVLHSSGNNSVFGVLLVTSSCVLHAAYFVLEEKLLKKVEIDGNVGVFNEGFWGSVQMSVLLPLLNTYPKKQPLENIRGWVYQSKNSGVIIGLIIGFVVSTAVYNQCGFQTTKLTSASVRSTFTALRPVIVWIISLSFGWEKVDKLGTPLTLIGFIILTFGILTYNNVLIVFPHKKNHNRTKLEYEHIPIVENMVEMKPVLQDE
ncbi:Transmembrane_domain-containing protein [Hexamita inflata]|uniref:Transmembrane domain-containing protein n=1 Tax=Hexamita inflata TaxID=28002 RepID=A0AA86QJH4_9EUKA|nr:Transmembrane domain-containing protein [Hexamita inflata]